MNMRRNARGTMGGAAAGVNQVLPKALAAKIEMHVNPNGLKDGEMRTFFVYMAQAITLQSHTITTQAEQQGIPKKNPPSSTMDSRLRDFTRKNPPVYSGSEIVEDLEEGVGQLCFMIAWTFPGLWYMSNKWKKK